MKGSMQRILLAAAVFATLCLAAPKEAQAQYGYGWAAQTFSPRLYLGAQLGYNHILNGSLYFETAEGVPDDGTDTHLTQSGFNWSVYLGLRFSPWIGLEVAWDALYHPSQEHAAFNYAVIDGLRVALRLHIPTGYNLEPFIRLGVGWYWYGDEFEADQDGFGYSAGLGVNYQLGPSLEFELMVLYRAWYFKGMDIGGEDDDFRCGGGGWCPFGDEYVHSVNVAFGFHWNSWIFAW